MATHSADGRLLTNQGGYSHNASECSILQANGTTFCRTSVNGVVLDLPQVADVGGKPSYEDAVRQVVWNSTFKKIVDEASDEKIRKPFWYYVS